MARKSRKATAAPTEAVEKVYDTAIYARLSVEDGGNAGSDSIDNQIYLVRQYVERQPDLRLCAIFADNGATGVNFDRPQFNAMMDEIRAGRVDCVCVKDLSRFGRNYVETGEYIEKIFPFMGTRFVAIHDGFDSQYGDSDALIVALKNLVNSVYVQDISQKIISALRTKQKNGEYIGGLPIYGYKKSGADRHKLVIDEQTAPIVREIFRMKAEGMGDPAIARQLNELGVPSPAKRLAERGDVKKPGRCKVYLWRDRAIRLITTNPMYLGHMTQGRTRQALCENARAKAAPQSEWIIVENTHEPIVDSEVFERARLARIANTGVFFREYDKNRHLPGDGYLFKGLLFCADCGSAMQRRKTGIGDRFFCPIQARRYGSDCSAKSVTESALYDSTLAALKAEAKAAVDLTAIVERLDSRRKADKHALSARILSTQREIRRLTNLKSTLYESYADKLLTEGEYVYSKQRYDRLIDEQKRELARLEEESFEQNETLTPKNGYLTAFRRFIDHDELSRETLTALIEKILVVDNERFEFVYRFMDEREAVREYAKAEEGADL